MKTQTMQHSTQAMDVQPNNPNQKENKTMKTQLRIASLSLLALICLTLSGHSRLGEPLGQRSD